MRVYSLARPQHGAGSRLACMSVCDSCCLPFWLVALLGCLDHAYDSVGGTVCAIAGFLAPALQAA
jgi:hypothetical protein